MNEPYASVDSLNKHLVFRKSENSTSSMEELYSEVNRKEIEEGSFDKQLGTDEDNRKITPTMETSLMHKEISIADTVEETGKSYVEEEIDCQDNVQVICTEVENSYHISQQRNTDSNDLSITNANDAETVETKRETRDTALEDLLNIAKENISTSSIGNDTCNKTTGNSECISLSLETDGVTEIAIENEPISISEEENILNNEGDCAVDPPCRIQSPYSMSVVEIEISTELNSKGSVTESAEDNDEIVRDAIDQNNSKENIPLEEISDPIGSESSSEDQISLGGNIDEGETDCTKDNRIEVEDDQRNPTVGSRTTIEFECKSSRIGSISRTSAVSGRETIASLHDPVKSKLHEDKPTLPFRI
ncbi:hypothetical protein JTB14_015655 [Gonioctena quinquepunctata]|nr:hypothetical protein JTB14_015655 [Gonioctena quinquepunctata]